MSVATLPCTMHSFFYGMLSLSCNCFSVRNVCKLVYANIDSVSALKKLTTRLMRTTRRKTRCHVTRKCHLAIHHVSVELHLCVLYLNTLKLLRVFYLSKFVCMSHFHRGKLTAVIWCPSIPLCHFS